MTEFQSYVNIRIYGQTIQKLENNGIDLKSVLNDLGITELEIGEGKVIRSSIPRPSQPVLSTTLVNEISVPRYSTPIPTKAPDLERKFTLNLPRYISKIFSNADEKKEYTDAYEENDEFEVHEVLNEMIDKVSKRENEKMLVERQFSDSFYSIVSHSFLGLRNPVDENLDLSWSDDQPKNPSFDHENADRTLRIDSKEEGEEDDEESEEGEEDEEGADNETEQNTKMEDEEKEVERKRSRRHTNFMETHDIRCKWPRCQGKFNWKLKYGRLRLFDHALLHCDKDYLKCEKCKESFRNIRQIRYHYKTCHKKAKTPNMNVLISNVKGFKKTVNTCFGNQVNLFDLVISVCSPPEIP